jgi:energy-converting hydrogenase Eha subunit A
MTASAFSFPLVHRPRPLHLAGVAGLAAVATYLGATLVGAAVSPGYSHLSDPISQLTAAQAPHRVALGAAYTVYNVAVALFALGLQRHAPTSRALRGASRLLVVGALAGIGQVTLFPQDQDVLGTSMTAVGVVHIVLAGLSAFVALAAAVLIGIALRRDLDRPRPARFSFSCAAIIAIVGPVAAAAVGSDTMGAAERLPIGTFLVWITGLAVWALREHDDRR